MKRAENSPTCDCGSNAAYPACCGRFIDDQQPAENAERLMRSRYTAYVRQDKAYLLQTWQAESRPATLDLEDGIRWLGLNILSFIETSADTAEVEFVTRSKLGGHPAMRLKERSRFVRVDGRWLYVDGVVSSASRSKRAG